MRQISKKLGKVFGEWSEETEADRPLVKWFCPFDLSAPEITCRPQLFQLQVQDSSKTGWARPGPAATTNDPLPCQRPISRDRDLQRSHLEKLMNILLKFFPKLLSFTKPWKPRTPGEQAAKLGALQGAPWALPSRSSHRMYISLPRVPSRLATRGAMNGQQQLVLG